MSMNEAAGKGLLSGKRILVVEDEPTIRRFYERLFGSYDLVVTFAPTGTIAMELLEAGRVFDVILLDVRLPGLSGRELWKLIEIKRPELRTRVILVTGDILGEGTRQLLEESGRPYLEKPFSTEDLVSVIEGVVRNPEDKTNRDKMHG